MKPMVMAAAVLVVAVSAGLGPAYGQMFGTPPGTSSGSPFGTSYGSPFGTPYGSPFGMASGSPFGSPFGVQGGAGGGGAGSTASGGSLLRGNERFIRGNRRSGDFVGNDLRARRGFIGSPQGGATQAVAPAAASVRVPRSADVNTEPATSVNRATGVYQPRVVLGFEVPRASSQAISAEVARQLAAIPGLHPTDRIVVSVEAGTATLRGAVASERDRSLIEKLILFEPGISAVRNDLQLIGRPGRSDENPSPGSLPTVVPAAPK